MARILKPKERPDAAFHELKTQTLPKPDVDFHEAKTQTLPRPDVHDGKTQVAPAPEVDVIPKTAVAEIPDGVIPKTEISPITENLDPDSENFTEDELQFHAQIRAQEKSPGDFVVEKSKEYFAGIAEKFAKKEKGPKPASRFDKFLDSFGVGNRWEKENAWLAFEEQQDRKYARQKREMKAALVREVEMAPKVAAEFIDSPGAKSRLAQEFRDEINDLREQVEQVAPIVSIDRTTKEALRVQETSAEFAGELFGRAMKRFDFVDATEQLGVLTRAGSDLVEGSKKELMAYLNESIAKGEIRKIDTGELRKMTDAEAAELIAYRDKVAAEKYDEVLGFHEAKTETLPKPDLDFHEAKTETLPRPDAGFNEAKTEEVPSPGVEAKTEEVPVQEEDTEVDIPAQEGHEAFTTADTEVAIPVQEDSSVLATADTEVAIPVQSGTPTSVETPRRLRAVRTGEDVMEGAVTPPERTSSPDLKAVRTPEDGIPVGEVVESEEGDEVVEGVPLEQVKTPEKKGYNGEAIHDFFVAAENMWIPDHRDAEGKNMRRWIDTSERKDWIEEFQQEVESGSVGVHRVADVLGNVISLVDSNGRRQQDSPEQQVLWKGIDAILKKTGVELVYPGPGDKITAEMMPNLSFHPDSRGAKVGDVITRPAIPGFAKDGVVIRAEVSVMDETKAKLPEAAIGTADSIPKVEIPAETAPLKKAAQQ